MKTARTFLIFGEKKAMMETVNIIDEWGQLTRDLYVVEISIENGQMDT